MDYVSIIPYRSCFVNVIMLEIMFKYVNLKPNIEKPPLFSFKNKKASSRLTYILAKKWWSNRDSNPGPPPCKGGALIS